MSSSDAAGSDTSGPAPARTKRGGQNVKGSFRVDSRVHQLAIDFCKVSESAINARRRLDRTLRELGLLHTAASRHPGVIESCVAFLHKQDQIETADRVRRGEFEYPDMLKGAGEADLPSDPFIERHETRFRAFVDCRRSANRAAADLDAFLCAMAKCQADVMWTLSEEFEHTGEKKLGDTLRRKHKLWECTDASWVKRLGVLAEASLGKAEEDISRHRPNQALITTLMDAETTPSSADSRDKQGLVDQQSMPWSIDPSSEPIDDETARAFDALKHLAAAENHFITTRHENLGRNASCKYTPPVMVSAAVAMREKAAEHLVKIGTPTLVSHFDPAVVASYPQLNVANINYDFLLVVESFMSGEIDDKAFQALQAFRGAQGTTPKSINNEGSKCRTARRNWLRRVLGRLITDHGGLSQWRKWLPSERLEIFRSLIAQEPLWIVSMAFWQMKLTVDFAVVCANPLSRPGGAEWDRLEGLREFAINIIADECELLFTFEIDFGPDHPPHDRTASDNEQQERVLQIMSKYVNAASKAICTPTNKQKYLKDWTFRDMPIGDFRAVVLSRRSRGVAALGNVNTYIQAAQPS